MARNGSGTFSLLAVTAPANTVSSSTTVNANMDDIATALTESINKDGTKAFAAAQSFGGFKATSLGSGSARTDGAALGQVQDGTANWVAGGGSADAITATYAPAITTLVDGQICFVRATAANATATPTFAPSGLTARTIVKQGGLALVANDIAGVGHELAMRYLLASTRWELLNPASMAIQSTDAGAGEGPVQTIDRFSGSPAASDILGATAFLGRSSTAVSRAYARIRAVAKTVTNASEDGLFAIRTMLAGTEADRVIVGAGLYTAGATSGDMGANTINATAYYVDGAALSAATVEVQTFTSTGADTWEKPTGGQTMAMIEVWAAGGSGGKGRAGSAAGGGGGGQYVRKIVALSGLGATEALSIGTGGAAQTVADSNGNVGGDTTFGTAGTLITAYGGGPGMGTDTTGLNGGGNGGGPNSAGVANTQALGGTYIVTNFTRSSVNEGMGGRVPSAASGGETGTSTTFNGAGGGGSASVDNLANGAGGNSVFGGAGGGAGAEDSAPGAGAGGTSQFGGAGGAGAFDANAATAGTAPGGGGGGSETGTSGAGGNGKAIVTCW